MRGSGQGLEDQQLEAEDKREYNRLLECPEPLPGTPITYPIWLKLVTDGHFLSPL